MSTLDSNKYGTARCKHQEAHEGLASEQCNPEYAAVTVRMRVIAQVARQRCEQGIVECEPGQHHRPRGRDGHGERGPLRARESPQTRRHGDQHLPPIPAIPPAAAPRFQQIPFKCLRMGPRRESAKHPGSEVRRVARRAHEGTSVSSFRPAESLENMTWAERRALRPTPVTSKYVRALPPRSGVGSPRLERTRPFASRRSSAA